MNVNPAIMGRITEGGGVGNATFAGHHAGECVRKGSTPRLSASGGTKSVAGLLHHHSLAIFFGALLLLLRRSLTLDTRLVDGELRALLVDAEFAGSGGDLVFCGLAALGGLNRRHRVDDPVFAGLASRHRQRECRCE